MGSWWAANSCKYWKLLRNKTTRRKKTQKVTPGILENKYPGEELHLGCYHSADCTAQHDKSRFSKQTCHFIALHRKSYAQSIHTCAVCLQTCWPHSSHILAAQGASSNENSIPPPSMCPHHTNRGSETEIQKHRRQRLSKLYSMKSLAASV